MIMTPALPRILILSLPSIKIPGDLSNTSNAELPTLITLFSTFTTIRSVNCWIKGFRPVTTTDCNSLDVGFNTISAILTEETSDERIKTGVKTFSNCIVLMRIKYEPKGIRSNSIKPDLSVIAAFASEESLVLSNTAEIGRAHV